jgi:hypothetical protein
VRFDWCWDRAVDGVWSRMEVLIKNGEKDGAGGGRHCSSNDLK